MIPNRPTPDGRAIGAQLTRLTDKQELDTRRRFPSHPERCTSCAFRDGTVPNGCLPTVLDAPKAVMEGDPFYCHQPNPGPDGAPTTPCAGWVIARDALPGHVPWPRPGPIRMRIPMKKVFDTLGGNFEACHEAVAWCQARDISVGAMQAHAPRGLLCGPYVIAKWRNLTDLERSELHGTITGDFRHGPVTVELRGEEEDYPIVPSRDHDTNDDDQYDAMYDGNLVGGRKAAHE